MILNVIVIVSIYWIRTPMTPILKMSLSLAAADACSSMLYAANLFGLDLMEMVKLMGIVVTVAHLLALSLNHYLGILKPLHYNSIVTKRKLTIVICMLWICPVIIVGTLCGVEMNSHTFQSENNTELIYMDFENNTNKLNVSEDPFNNFRFRISYASLFFIPMVFMAFFYTHILIIVRKQQKVWKHLSRIGSTKWKGRSVNGCPSNRVIREQKQLEGNLRAICTTLLIMGSCFIGWMPALLLYSLMCEKGCFWQGDSLCELNRKHIKGIMTIRFIENLLIIMKMLANAVIYSIRMKEIKTYDNPIEKMELKY
ncbi:unnamed protein product [Brassicogethes aeneus]|uniref:G-protein coupled receptors family 1 profile domain-containing protein n=1 Tax=Brassicogethes aeneus TaxID=1431903 RepID=A0A9P0FBY3_BRAAE|nr:unnamed protein product [Brassicogethes aeneus]